MSSVFFSRLSFVNISSFLSIWHQDEWVQISLFFKSSWCKILVASAERNGRNCVPPRKQRRPLPFLLYKSFYYIYGGAGAEGVYWWAALLSAAGGSAARPLHPPSQLHPLRTAVHQQDHRRYRGRRERDSLDVRHHEVRGRRFITLNKSVI